MASRWYTIGEFTQVSNDEARMASNLRTIIDTGGAEILSVATINVNGTTDTTVLVLDRADEHLAFIQRMDGSVVVATDNYGLS